MIIFGFDRIEHIVLDLEIFPQVCLEYQGSLPRNNRNFSSPCWGTMKYAPLESIEISLRVNCKLIEIHEYSPFLHMPRMKLNPIPLSRPTRALRCTIDPHVSPLCPS